MDGQKIISTHNFYSEEFKLKVVQEVLSGQLTKAQANRKYGIKGSSRILDWIKKHGNKFGKVKNNSYIEADNSFLMTESDNTELELIKQENDKLKKELSFASMRVIALETLIDVAEKELKINLRKKCSTKQSRKSDNEIK
jgi:transposase